MDSTPCPRCDGQGTVRLYAVSQTTRRLLVCDECEAAWLRTDAVEVTNMQDLTAFGVHDWNVLHPVAD